MHYKLNNHDQKKCMLLLLVASNMSCCWYVLKGFKFLKNILSQKCRDVFSTRKRCSLKNIQRVTSKGIGSVLKRLCAKSENHECYTETTRNKSLNITHHHHHGMPLAQISLTFSRHLSLSSIALDRSSMLHPLSVQSCCR